jgi:transcriptional regulator with XRE-family HTH domain
MGSSFSLHGQHSFFLLRIECCVDQLKSPLSSGVSNAMVCLIEGGKTNPSLGLLKNLLDVIPISVSEFFSLELEDEPTKIFYAKDDLSEIGSGLISYLQLGSNAQNINL